MIIDKTQKKVYFKIKNLNKLTRYGIERGAYTSGIQIKKNTSKEILKKPKGGRVYIRRTKGGGRRRHVASAPFETHANMTGALRRSLSFKVNPRQLEFGYGLAIESAPEYAGFVEFGTKNMKPRPSLLNGITSSQNVITSNMNREIKKRIE